MSEYVFNRDAVRRFHFTDCAFDAATGIARLDYAFDTGGMFSETITFPGAPFTLAAARTAAVKSALPSCAPSALSRLALAPANETPAACTLSGSPVRRGCHAGRGLWVQSNL